MRFMFVVAHPDDEVLGAGGFISKRIKNKDDVCVVILNADYEKTRENMFNDINKSHQILGINNKALFSYKNMDFYNEDHRDMVETIEGEIRSFKPDYVFTHNDKDLHNDHRVTSFCVQQAVKLWQRNPEEKENRIKGLFFIEVLSSTDWSLYSFKPDFYVEISKEDLDKKIKALECYKNVIRKQPHPRSIECIKALSVVRGAEIGYNFAEGFKVGWLCESF